MGACQPVPQLASCVAEGPLAAAAARYTMSYNAPVQWAGMAAGDEYTAEC